VRRAILAAVMVAAVAHPAAADLSDRGTIVITDATSDALMASLFVERIDRATHAAPFYVGVAGYALGGPIVHAAHGDWGRAGISLSARVVLPVVGIVGGHELCVAGSDEDHDELLPCFGSMILGGIAGIVGAEVLDWAAVSRGPEPRTMMLSFGAAF
jgi:hypothetical protein